MFKTVLHSHFLKIGVEKYFNYKFYVAHFGHFAGNFYSHFDLSYKQSRHWRNDTA